MAVAGLAARAGAVAILAAVLDDGLLPDMGTTALDPADRARAQRLAALVLRHLDRCDRVLAPHLRKTPPPFVRHVLRLAVAEMALGGAAAHGAVNAGVELVRQAPRGAPFAGLVNAVLRKVAGPRFDGMPVQKMPQWLRQPLVHAWGRPAVAAMEAVQAAEPPLDLTLRPGAEVDIPGAVRLPTGSLRLAAGQHVSALPGYAQGLWWVQDAGAALAAQVLDAQPGERVIDLCVAPGGKTMQMAAAGAAVTAVDISGPRLTRLRDNLARTGLEAQVVTADVLHWMPDIPAEAVLLDAPCSATGTIRRHPELPHLRDGSDLPALVALQAALIDRAVGMLAPGGRLVFCTCSVLPDEGEVLLAAALDRHPGLRVDPVLPAGADPAWATAEGALRLRPDHWADRGGIDGFFIARLRKADA
ncbi:MAG: RsmB/NOP family class I SAM-dependent RNA methyltransferase [Gemmobacter sp.]